MMPYPEFYAGTLFELKDCLVMMLSLDTTFIFVFEIRNDALSTGWTVHGRHIQLYRTTELQTLYTRSTVCRFTSCKALRLFA
jgi:hypothetical protein